MSKKMWLVRAGAEAYLFDEFINKKVVAIGWTRTGGISNIDDLDTIKTLLRKQYPEYKEGKISITAGQIHRFKNVFKLEDQVVTYNPGERTYHIGKIISEYEYNESIVEDMHHIRRVEWTGKVLRDDLTPSARNTLGSIMTIIEIPLNVQREMGTMSIESTT